MDVGQISTSADTVEPPGGGGVPDGEIYRGAAWIDRYAQGLQNTYIATLVEPL